MESFWAEGLSIVRDRIPPQSYEAWIECLKPKALEGDQFILEVPTNPMREWISDRYKGILEQSLSTATSRPISIYFALPPTAPAPVDGEASPREDDPRDDPRDEPLEGLQLELVSQESGIDPRYQFGNFVVGNCNQFAHAAGLAVSNRLVKGYNPLFVYGHVGLGKTHLIHAVGNRVLSRKPTFCSVYCTAEAFTNELIDAIKDDRHEEFREKYRSVDLLLIDDIQLIAGKERTQEEFFYTFNALYQQQKQIVVTSDRFPKDIPDLEDRIRSRFEWGLIADMQAPDYETRVAILRRKAQTDDLEIPDDVIEFLATHIRSNIRELEGSLNRVSAFANLTSTPLTIEVVRKVMHESIREARREITIDEIQRCVARHHQLKPADLRSDRKVRTLTLPRQIAMYLCRRLTPASYPEIGDQFGGRDHSTVIHAVRKIERQIAEDGKIQAEIEALVSKLEDGI